MSISSSAPSHISSANTDTSDEPSKAIHAIAYSPDGHHIATGCADGAIRLWKTKTLEQVGEDLRGHSGEVLSITYSPDGGRLVSGSDDDTVRVWDMETCEEVLNLRGVHDSAVRAVAYSPDGSLIASGGVDRLLKLWDAVTGECIVTISNHSDTIMHITFSPDGRHLATGSNDRLIRVIDIEERQLAFEPISGHKASVLSVAYSPDGSLLASASRDHTIRIWDATSGKLHKGPFKSHKLAVSSIAFSPDGHHILSSSADRTVCIWDVSTQKVVVGPLFGHDSEVTAAFSPDGKLFVSGDYDGVVRIWDAVTGNAQLPPLSEEDIKCFHDRKVTASQGMNALNLVNALAWFPDGHHFATAEEGNVIRMWDTETGKESSDPFFGHIGPVTAISISHDSKLLASGSGDGTVRLWDPKTAAETKVSPLRGHTGPVADVKLTPDSARLVTCGVEDEIRIWDTCTGKIVSALEGSKSTYSSLSISADGTRLASGSLSDKSVSVWDLGSLKRIAGPFPNDGAVVHVSFSRDGARVFSGARDKGARTWDVARGEQVQLARELNAASSLKTMDYTPDGTRFLSVANDKSVWIRSTTDVKRAAGALVHEVEVHRAVFSPDGKHVLTACVDGSLRIWDVGTGSVILPRDKADGSSEDKSNDGSRDSDDDSIMNMPTTIRSPAQRRSAAAQRFFDDFDDEPEPKRERSPTGPRTDTEIAPRHHVKRRGFFERSVGSLTAKLKFRRKKNTAAAAPAQNTTQMSRVRDQGARTDTARIRVFASGEHSRGRRRARSPESDDGSSSPVRQGGPRRSASVDSEYGCMGALCFCTCLPLSR